MKKFVIGGIVLVLITVGWSTMSVGEQRPAPRGELRIVDMHPANWASVTLHVFEHLIELDKDGKLVPRLATSSQ